MNRKIKIVFIIHSLHSGGSERVTLHLIKNLSRNKFSITLILLKREGQLLPLLPKDISVIGHNFSRTASAFFRIFRNIVSLRPDIVFSTLNQVNLMVSLLIPFLPKKIIFIARESSIISEQIKHDRYPTLFNILYRTTFGRFQSIICQSIAMKQDMVENFSVDATKIKVINNPVDLGSMPMAPQETNSERPVHLISVGRLRKEKGYDRLIRALAKCQIPFRYTIIGDGPLKNEISDAIEANQLKDKVEMLGAIPLPYQYIITADLFLQGSYYEGFPNAVIEANACGVPVIAWTSIGGTNEIIVNGINGWIINSEDELCTLITSKSFLKIDKSVMTSMIQDRYGLVKIISEYESHFEQMIQPTNRKEAP